MINRLAELSVKCPFKAEDSLKMRKSVFLKEIIYYRMSMKRASFVQENSLQVFVSLTISNVVFGKQGTH